ncbi:MAG: hypothetical protein QM770_07975 [Tepidisphaeraceae bacterium]
MLTFRVRGRSADGKPAEWHLLPTLVAEFAALLEAPQPAVIASCKKAAMWLNANPDKTKTNGGMKKFLTRWLMKDADSGTLRATNGRPQIRIGFHDDGPRPPLAQRGEGCARPLSTRTPGVPMKYGR